MQIVLAVLTVFALASCAPSPTNKTGQKQDVLQAYYAGTKHQGCMTLASVEDYFRSTEQARPFTVYRLHFVPQGTKQTFTHLLVVDDIAAFKREHLGKERQVRITNGGDVAFGTRCLGIFGI